MNKDLSTFDWKDVHEWLQKNNMEKYVKNFQSFNVNGYDLCYLANEDFAEMSITNFHDKNIILKNIRTMTLKELKIKMEYEGRKVTIQLDFEPLFTVEMLCVSLCELFHIPNKIYLSTNDGEVLMPNIKIVELILLNPQKYKQLKIITEKDTFPLSGNSTLTKGYSSRIEENSSKVNEEKSNQNEIEHKVKEIKDSYVLYDVSKKFEKNDIEKDYLFYKESKASNYNIQTNSNKNFSNNSFNRERDQNHYSKDSMISQNKLEYKRYQDLDSHRLPIENQRFNMSFNEKAHQAVNFLNSSNETEQKFNCKNEQSNIEKYGCHNHKFDKGSKSNIHDNYRLPLPLDDINKESSYSNYNPSSYQPNKMNEDNKKFSSEKRSYRSSDPNENDNEMLIKPLDKYSSYNEKSLIKEQYIRKTPSESMNNSQKRYDLMNKNRLSSNYDDEPTTKVGLQRKGGLLYGDRERKFIH